MESEVEEGEIRESECLSSLSDDGFVQRTVEIKRRVVHRRSNGEICVTKRRHSNRRQRSISPKRSRRWSNDSLNRRRQKRLSLSASRQRRSPSPFHCVADSRNNDSRKHNSVSITKNTSQSSSRTRGGGSSKTLSSVSNKNSRSKVTSSQIRRAKQRLKNGSNSNSNVPKTSRNSSAANVHIRSSRHSQSSLSLEQNGLDPEPKQQVAVGDSLHSKAKKSSLRDSANTEAITDDESDVEVLSIIEKPIKEAEIIVLDSTSSSESEDEKEQDNDDGENQQCVEKDIEAEEVAIPNEIPASDKNTSTAATIGIESVVEEQDLEELELRKRALLGMVKKLNPADVPASDISPSCDTAKADDHILSKTVPGTMKLDDNIPTRFVELNEDITTMRTAQWINETNMENVRVPDDSEKENEMEILLLREELLQDLARKKKPSNETTIPSATISHNTDKNNITFDSLHSFSFSKSSHVRNAVANVRGSHLDTRSIRNDNNQCITSGREHESPSSYSYCPTTNRAVTNFSVSVSKNGNNRTVICHKSPSPPAPPLISPPIKNTRRIVEVIDMNELHVSNSTQQLITNISLQNGSFIEPTSLPIVQPSAFSPPPYQASISAQNVASTVSTNSASKNFAQNRVCNISNDIFRITRTVVNTQASKSMYNRSTVNRQINKNSSGAPFVKKKYPKIVIPLRDGDESTDDELEGNKATESNTNLGTNTLPESFHSSLDKFLKTVRESASLNQARLAIPVSSMVSQNTTNANAGQQHNPPPEGQNFPVETGNQHGASSPSQSPKIPENCHRSQSPNRLQISSTPSDCVSEDLSNKKTHISAATGVLKSTVLIQKKAYVARSRTVEPNKIYLQNDSESNITSHPVVRKKLTAKSIINESNKVITQPINSVPKTQMPCASSQTSNAIEKTKIDETTEKNNSLNTLFRIAQPSEIEKLRVSRTAESGSSPIVTKLILEKHPELSLMRCSHPTTNPVESPVRAKQTGSDLAKQVCQTRQELHLREKLLRATLQRNEERLKLSGKEKELIHIRHATNKLLGKAIDIISKREEREKQCTQLENKVEKIRKQLEIVEKSLSVAKDETASLHDDAAKAVEQAFKIRAESVKLGNYCRALGMQIVGGNYRIPSAGAADMLLKMKDIYKRTVNGQNLKRGNFQIKDVERQINDALKTPKTLPVTNSIQPKASSSSRPIRKPGNAENSNLSDEELWNKLRSQGLTRYLRSAKRSDDGQCCKAFKHGTDFSVLPIITKVLQKENLRFDIFVPYQSPLECLNPCGFVVNPNATVCRDNINDTCHDLKCKYQHLQ